MNGAGRVERRDHGAGQDPSVVEHYESRVRDSRDPTPTWVPDMNDAEELQNACHTLAEQLNDAQRLRIEAHELFVVARDKKQAIDDEIAAVRQKARLLHEQLEPDLSILEASLEGKQQRLDARKAEIQEEIRRAEKSANAEVEEFAKANNPAKQTLQHRVEAMKSEQEALASFIPDCQSISAKSQKDQEETAREIKLASESLVLWGKHQLHSFVERDILHRQTKSRQMRSSISHTQKQVTLADQELISLAAEKKVLAKYLSVHARHRDNKWRSDVAQLVKCIQTRIEKQKHGVDNIHGAS
jgi:hypothetical protein